MIPYLMHAYIYLSTVIPLPQFSFIPQTTVRLSLGRVQNQKLVQMVELAALLYTGEYVHARHTWRRWSSSHNPPALLVDWWQVGAAMMTGDPSGGVWPGLAHIEANHPAPLNRYAAEVGRAYRRRLLQTFRSPRPHTHPSWRLLNCASSVELEEFRRKEGLTASVGRDGVDILSAAGKASSGRGLMKSGMVDSKASLTQVVTFLECTSKADRYA